MGFDKILAPLADRPVVAHSVSAYAAMPFVGRMVIVAHPRRVSELETGLRPYAGKQPLRVVAGGATRSDSVRHGLEALPEDAEWVAVHDGARPFITTKAVETCWNLARTHGCAACAAPVTDTLKRTEPGEPVMTGDVPREHLWALQTPQIARRSELIYALTSAAQQNHPLTDETSAIRFLGKPAAISDNPDWNPKITYPRDLELAEAWLSKIQVN